MAAQDTANIRPDIWEVFIDHANAPFHAVVSKGPDLDQVPVTTQRYGSTPIGHLVQGWKGELSFEFQEWTIEDLKRWNGITANTAAENHLPAIGTLMPTHHVRLHNAGDGAVVSKDICFPAVAFGSFSLNADGVGEGTQTVPAMATLDPTTGKMVVYGYVEPAQG